MSEEEINFEEFEELEQDLSNEKVEEQQIDESVMEGSEEIRLGGSVGYKYLKNPEAGQSIVLEMLRIEKSPSRSLKNLTDGSTFETGLLSKKTGKRTELKIITVNNECFNINSWDLWYKLNDKNGDIVKKVNQQNGSCKGIKVKITRVYNGKDSKTSATDLMKLRGFKTIEEAEEHKKIVGKANKEGGIYKVELVE